MFCGRCQIDVHPMQALGGPGRVSNVCPKCSNFLDNAPPAEPATMSTSGLAATLALFDAAPKAQPVGDWQEMLRSKRALLRVEVQALEAKRAELNKLERMLALLDASEESPCS